MIMETFCFLSSNSSPLNYFPRGGTWDKRTSHPLLTGAAGHLTGSLDLERSPFPNTEHVGSLNPELAWLLALCWASLCCTGCILIQKLACGGVSSHLGCQQN